MSEEIENGSQRLDQWLWQTRFFKTRSMTSKLCVARKVRVNGIKVDKAHYRIRAGDVLTFPQARTVRVIRVAGLATRRGPAAEAQSLYVDLEAGKPCCPGDPVSDA